MGTSQIDFFIVGAMKSGTTSLRAALGRRSDIDMAKSELHFFDHDGNFAEGFDAYFENFDMDGDYRLRGEKSPSYSLVATAAERIHAYNPDARIVWSLRDPVERAVSNFFHAKKRKPDALSMTAALDRAEELEAKNHTMAYLFRSQYEKHLAFYDAVFPPEQMHISIFEEMLEDPDGEIHRLEQFLGYDDHLTRKKMPHRNKGVEEVMNTYEVTDAERARLKPLLAPTVAAIEARLGRRIPAWHT
ncbi:sulfotransferase family protein [Poseidonocella sedimentorum]|uniref:Sulfotransferase domain-containing protein n=1 Tax=Poseidonocella sedimentorum TaxID=871652 RepID=A0A1I6ED43_9RHOB|nr:sulfotransferase [Poseidonocella sedimentorum]SFR15660.1 Sulfotransferase domain-containing protein [Poseidonocella sedimentorum]